MLASPIIFGDQVIGVIIAYTNQSHRFNNEERKVFQTWLKLSTGHSERTPILTHSRAKISTAQ